MTSKVCLITGATNGIGLATAHALAARGISLVIHGRNASRLEAAQDALLSVSGQAGVETIQADFSSLDEVRTMAMEFSTRFKSLDILINNAGLLTDHRQTGADGFELTFTVNHLAPMLLTWSLLPALQHSAPARLMFNSSSALGSAQLNLDDLQSERWDSGWTAYANSKLANMLMANLLAERLAGTGIVSNSFCPGLINTGLLKNTAEFSGARLEYITKTARSPADGAATAIYLATEPAAEKITGAFFLKSHDAGRQPLHIPWDREIALGLWVQTEQLLQPWLTDSTDQSAGLA